MADRLLRMQSPAGLWAWMNLSYNKHRTKKSSYRALHIEYIRTDVHTLDTIYLPMCIIPYNPHLSVD